jgi:enoyl-CoA hydratase
LRHRLNPAAFQRAVTLSEYFDAEAAQRAGFFDELVDPVDLIPRAEAWAVELRELDQRAHKATKRRIRKALVRRLRYSVPLDLLDAAMVGMRSGRPG